MRCSHCNTINPASTLFTHPVEGGRAYAQACVGCGRIIAIRPQGDTDPPAAPPELDRKQIERLRFVQWRLQKECWEQVHRNRSLK